MAQTQEGDVVGRTIIGARSMTQAEAKSERSWSGGAR